MPETTQETSRSRAVSHLQGIYSVLVGLALAEAITKVIDQSASIPIHWDVAPYFLAYLVTLVPIYHGAVRHLDMIYVEASDLEMKASTLIADWAMLFLEGCLLLVLALLLSPQGETFSYALTVFLLFDAVWAFIAYQLASTTARSGRQFEQVWAFLNGGTVVVLILAMIWMKADAPVRTYRYILVPLIAVVRTILDYTLCGTVYCPPSILKATTATNHTATTATDAGNRTQT